MKNFRWHREFVTQSTYLRNSNEKSAGKIEYTVKERLKANGQKEYILSDDFVSAINKSKRERAYEIASDIRKFEIGLFWQRAAYFWAFITVVYAAYFKVLKDIYDREHGRLPLVILCLLGLFFSFSWFLTSKASKHWQENWELHLDLLEDEVTGPLYKTYLEEKSYSASKINIYAGVIVSICAGGLLLYEFAVFAKERLHLNGWLGVSVCLLFFLLVLFGLFVYAKKSIGNSDSTGDNGLQRKVYEE